MGAVWGDSRWDGLARSPLARRTPLKRFTRLKPVSDKRKAQRGDYEQARAVVWRRDVCCQGPARGLDGECWGLLDPHHIKSQRMYPELRCDPDVMVLLCRLHHDSVHGDLRRARALGLVA
jgi:hypothetical protein